MSALKAALEQSVRQQREKVVREAVLDLSHDIRFVFYPDKSCQMVRADLKVVRSRLDDIIAYIEGEGE